MPKNHAIGTHNVISNQGSQILDFCDRLESRYFLMVNKKKRGLSESVFTECWWYLQSKIHEVVQYQEVFFGNKLLLSFLGTKTSISYCQTPKLWNSIRELFFFLNISSFFFINYSGFNKILFSSSLYSSQLW